VKILHTEASCGWGGQELRIVHESVRCINRGHEVLIACNDDSQFFERGSGFVSPSVLRFIRIGSKSIVAIYDLCRLIERERPDIVISHSSIDSWIVGIALKIMGSKAAQIAWVRYRHVSAPIVPNPFTRWIYSQPHAVITTAACIGEQVQSVSTLPPKRIISIPTGVDLREFEERKFKKRSEGYQATLLMVSTLRSWKGHVQAIDALAEIPGVNLLIVGNGPQLQALKQKVDTLSLTERVSFRGHLPSVSGEFCKADIFLAPSLANEGISQSLLQAMAVGLPIVASALPSFLEILEDGENCILVPPHNVESLKQAILTLLNDEVLAKRLGSRARERVERAGSIEDMINQVLAVYESVLDEVRLESIR